METPDVNATARKAMERPRDTLARKGDDIMMTPVDGGSWWHQSPPSGPRQRPRRLVTPWRRLQEAAGSPNPHLGHERAKVAQCLSGVHRARRTLRDFKCRLSERQSSCARHSAPTVIKESFSNARRSFLFSSESILRTCFKGVSPPRSVAKRQKSAVRVPGEGSFARSASGESSKMSNSNQKKVSVLQ